MEVCFITPLEVTEVDDSTWVLTTPFVLTIDGKTFTVEQGFQTDFASVPRLPFTYWFFGDITHRPAVIHDWLYTQGGDENDRSFADSVLYHAMIADGVSSIKAKCMYAAVRMFGKSHWLLKGVK